VFKGGGWTVDQTRGIQVGGQTEIDSAQTRARFELEVKAATRATGITAGAVATIAYPSWALFDFLVEPSRAPDFLWLRVGFAIPIALLWLGLWRTRLGRTNPEVFVVGMMWMVGLGIALMTVSVESHYAAYALGMSLPFWAGAFLLCWPPRYMAWVIALNTGSLVAVLLLSDPIGADAIATIFFYLGTAALLSFLGQYHRQRVAWGEFRALAALEREQARNEELLEELDRQSREDALTCLANRRAWDETLGRQTAQSKRDDSAFSVLICDIDQLKAINDQLGHAMGDLVIRAVGRVLKENARGGDLVARLGGDEFALLLPGAELLSATELAERLRAATESEVNAAAAIGGVSLSIGVADWEGVDDSSETIMLRADRRLYRAKARRNVVCAGDGARTV